MTPPHYRRPGWFTRNLFNRAVATATRLGISVWGSRILETTGRTSGLPRRTPVNLLTYGGREYLVSPRGETQWVRNARAAGGRMTLILGRKRREVIGTELADEDKVEVLRAYLTRWKMEVGVFFGGVGPDSSDEQIRAIAGRHPAFAVTAS
ncbi:MAG: nitroreductase family deazaflavin-dependent oxidoreductase [Acidimicrobiales bacterium]|nr:nitroreductase family deazaflavin-dependent oxidoreductase [Acidimicrobiales bacterium]